MSKASHLFAAALTLICAACDDDVVAPSAVLQEQVPVGAVQAAIQRVPGERAGEVTFVVRVVSNGVAIGAFQGTVTFTPGLAPVAFASPQGDDATHVLNTREFAEGRIRFAAFTANGFVDADSPNGTEAFRFTVKGAEGANDFVAELTAVGTANGTTIDASRVLASSGVANTAGLLVPAR